MIQGLHTAFSALSANQAAIDNVANNLANANTVGYKSKTHRFSELLNSDILKPGGREQNLKRGSGVKAASTAPTFGQGITLQTGDALDFAIDGEGFFGLQSGDGMIYTRDGNFHISNEAGGSFLVNAAGDYVIGKNGGRVYTGEGFSADNIAVFDFANPYELQIGGENSYKATELSGEAYRVGTDVIQGCLEGSNTDMIGEMTELMALQRAYSMSAKMVQTADEIESIINNLRG